MKIGNNHNFTGVYNYSLNNGNIRGRIVTQNGTKVFKHENRVKLGGYSDKIQISSDNHELKLKRKSLSLALQRYSFFR